jgi:hypothetical protein
MALMLGASLVVAGGLFVPAAHAFEVIPSLGMTKSTDTNAGDGKLFGGLAVRFPLLPFVKIEGGIAYRQDEILDSNIQIRQWPMTLSLWLTPAPLVYAGAGIGWYRTTLDFPSTTPLLKDSTSQKVGVHLGGGLVIPIAPRLGLDVHGRYIFMQADDTSPLVPSTFNPDFWTLGAGLAIKF